MLPKVSVLSLSGTIAMTSRDAGSSSSRARQARVT
jgi:L-asparaginase/Glu-tRNA(Gln) amidotransferase subunit D